MIDEENEYELLYRARCEDEWAIETLQKMFIPFVVKTYNRIQAKRYNFEFDEALQAANLGLMSAIYYYREDKNPNFRSFAMLCIERHILNAFRKVKMISSVDYCSNLSLDRKVNDEDEMYLSEVISDGKSLNPEQEYYYHNYLEQIYEIISDNKRDVAVLRLRLEGYSYSEIAEKLNIKKKDVDNSVQKIRRKISNLFD